MGLKTLPQYNNGSYIVASGRKYDYSAAEITLTADQVASGEKTAALRWEASKNFKDKDGFKKDYEQEKLTSLAEVAFHVALSKFVDSPYYHSVNEWNLPDATIKGRPVDIKCSVHPNLLVGKSNLHSGWFYAAVQSMGDNRFRLVGYTSFGGVTGYGVETKGNRNPAYIVNRADLKPFPQFIGEPL